MLIVLTIIITVIICTIIGIFILIPVGIIFSVSVVGYEQAHQTWYFWNEVKKALKKYIWAIKKTRREMK